MVVPTFRRVHAFFLPSLSAQETDREERDREERDTKEIREERADFFLCVCVSGYVRLDVYFRAHTVLMCVYNFYTHSHSITHIFPKNGCHLKVTAPYGSSLQTFLLDRWW